MNLNADISKIHALL